MQFNQHLYTVFSMYYIVNHYHFFTFHMENHYMVLQVSKWNKVNPRHYLTWERNLSTTRVNITEVAALLLLDLRRDTRRTDNFARPTFFLLNYKLTNQASQRAHFFLVIGWSNNWLLWKHFNPMASLSQLRTSAHSTSYFLILWIKIWKKIDMLFTWK